MTREEAIVLGNGRLKSQTNFIEHIRQPPSIIPAVDKTSIVRHNENKTTIAKTYLIQAQLYIQEGQWQQAIAACQNALNFNPYLAEAYKIWGNGLQKLDRNAEAVGCYAKALEIQPNMPEIYANLGTLYARKKAWFEAIEYFEECIALNSEYAGAYRSLAKIWEELGETDKAWSCLFQALDLEPDIMTARQYCEAADKLLVRQETEKAIAFYRYAVQLDEYFQGVYIKLINTLERSGKHKEAVFYYRKLKEVKNKPQLARSSNKFVSKFLAASDKSSAFARKPNVDGQQYPALEGELPSFARSLQPSSQDLPLETTGDRAKQLNSASTQINLGNSYLKNKEWDKAIACYRQAIQLDPKLTVAYRNLGNVYQALGKKQEAFAVYFRLAEVSAEGGNYQLAIECYCKAIKLNPSHSQSYHNLGDALAKQEKWTKAALAYQKAIKIEPNFSWSYNNLGDVYQQLQQWDKAVHFYQEAIEINSTFYWSHYNLGEALGKLFRWKEAALAYQKAIALKPDFAEAYAHLGDALIREERWSEGAKYYEKAIEINPGIDVAVYRNLKEALERKKYLQPQQPKLRPWPYDSIKKYQSPETLPDGSPWPKISIVTPSYNQGKFIEETILSVVHQDYPNVEYILIDGASTDETPQIIERYREHFSYVVSEPDRGQSEAINKGFRRATGEIFAWLNSDDRLAPGALYAMALAFHTSDADVVAGICQIYKDGKEIERHLTSHTNGKISLNDILDLENCWLQGKFFYQPEVMFTREIWERSGSKVNEALYYSMDYEMWARFAAKGAKLQVIGSPIAQYRMHEQQKTSTIEKYQPELLQVRESFEQKYNIARNNELQLPLKQRRLKIAVLNDTGYLGGAGIANQRIAQALALAGHSVVNVAGTLDWSLTPVNCSAEEVDQIISSLAPDLLFIGNIHNFQYSLDILEKLTSRYPTVFVMHDQWLFTGRCGYTGGCEKYTTICDAECPTWEQYPRLIPSKIADAFNRKQALIQNSDRTGEKTHRFLVLGDSKWLANWSRYAYLNHATAENYLQFNSKFQHLYYGLDLEVFRPLDKIDCRRQLGLPEDKFIILTGSQSLEDERKGFKHLLQALEIADLSNAMVLCFGHDFQLETNLDIKAIGYVENSSLLARYYSAADLFISPALAEAFGQTFIEAAACGTPAVGYGVGGVKEAIGDRLTGRIVEQKTPQALAQTILELYGERSQLERLSKLAPWYVANNFSLASSYHSIIDALNNSGLLSDLRMAAVSKFAVNNLTEVQYITIKGNNPNSDLNDSRNSLPREIAMNESLQGSGWHPAENVNGFMARWMEKLGTIFVEPINFSSANSLLLELKVITAIDLQLLDTIIIKINGNSITTKIQSNNNHWICWGKIPLNLLPQGVAFVITVEAAEAKQLSPQDLRKGSLLVESLTFKPQD